MLLLERDELTSGSTWHAAGNVPTFSTGWSVMRVQQYSADLYRRLAEDAESPMSYHVTGSVRLAHTRERMAEFMHVASMARANGMDYDMLIPSRAGRALPAGAHPRPRRRAVGSARRRHRSVAGDPGVGHRGTRHGLPDPARSNGSPGSSSKPNHEWIVTHAAWRRSNARSWSTPPATAPAR